MAREMLLTEFNTRQGAVSFPFIVRRERKSIKPSKMQRGALSSRPAITDISFGAIVPLNALSSRSSYPPERLGNPMAEYSRPPTS